MMKVLLAVMMIMLAASAHAQEVKYIDAPKFEGQIFLYDEHSDSDVNYEQWYEIQGRGQFVRNVKVPTLIPYLPDPAKSNGAAGLRVLRDHHCTWRSVPSSHVW